LGITSVSFNQNIGGKIINQIKYEIAESLIKPYAGGKINSFIEKIGMFKKCFTRITSSPNVILWTKWNNRIND